MSNHVEYTKQCKNGDIHLKIPLKEDLIRSQNKEDKVFTSDLVTNDKFFQLIIFNQIICPSL